MIKLDVDDSATNHSGATVTMTGMEIDLSSSNAQGTTVNNGITISAQGAASNYALTTTNGHVGINTNAPTCALHVAGAFAAAGPSKTFQTFSDGDTTPSVANGNVFKHHASTETITNFDDGVDGQVIYVLSTAAITYDVTGTNLKAGTTDLVTANEDLTIWINIGGTMWYLINHIDQQVNHN